VDDKPATKDVSVTGPDDGEVIGLGPARIRILEDGRTTGHRLGMAEIVLAPLSAGPPQHRHARHDEGFYVVSGTARFTVGETDYDAPPGTLGRPLTDAEILGVMRRYATSPAEPA
jgi:quercetin dioxygenase-like cupin family protein